MKTMWEDLFKVKIANSSVAMLKHEVVKTILVIKLLNKFKKFRNQIKIYTEFRLDNGLRPDVYFENLKTKEAIAFEIQKDYSEKWMISRTKSYKDYTVPFFKSFDWIPIDLNDFSNDIKEIYKRLGDYI